MQTVLIYVMPVVCTSAGTALGAGGAPENAEIVTQQKLPNGDEVQMVLIYVMPVVCTSAGTALGAGGAPENAEIVTQ